MKKIEKRKHKEWKIKEEMEKGRQLTKKRKKVRNEKEEEKKQGEGEESEWNSLQSELVGKIRSKLNVFFSIWIFWVTLMLPTARQGKLHALAKMAFFKCMEKSVWNCKPS